MGEEKGRPPLSAARSPPWGRDTSQSPVPEQLGVRGREKLVCGEWLATVAVLTIATLGRHFLLCLWLSGASFLKHNWNLKLGLMSGRLDEISTYTAQKASGAR